jgi:hypothetical protein
MRVVVVVICVNNFAHDYSLLTVGKINNVLGLGDVSYVVTKCVALVMDNGCQLRRIQLPSEGLHGCSSNPVYDQV